MDVRKRISCQRCRLRKIRCDRVYPCGTCTSSGADCIFRDDDVRRRPASRAYVAALERKITSYEQLLTRLRRSSESERNELLESREHAFPDSQSNVGNADEDFDYTGSSRRSTMHMLSENKGSSSFYGPTSVYSTEIMPPKMGQALPNEPYRILERWHDMRLHESLGLEREVMVKALSCFFKYQHSQCMFIHRNAFLKDYETLEYDSEFCSYPLLYAACSLGARMSADSQTYQHAGLFSHISYEMISKRGLESPHLTTIPTLLCLAFSELSQGHNSKGWMLSGMAFRMVQDLGLHQDPKFVASDETTEDHEVRRHVYWGCYTVDKIISLYFGRPLSLHEEDAAVDPIEPSRLPAESNESTNIFEFEESTESDKLLPLMLQQLAELGKIIEAILSQVFSTQMIKKSRKDLVMIRLMRLEELSLRLFRWHAALPETITWNSWVLKANDLHSHTLTLHVIYHSTLISLNRHFIRPTPGFARKSQSKEICMTSVDSIIAILRHYRTQCPLSRCPIVLIYGAIMAGTALSFARESDTTEAAYSTEDGKGYLETELHYRLKTLVKMLEEVSQTYPPAHEASLRLKTSFGLASRELQNQQVTKVPEGYEDENYLSEVQGSLPSRLSPGDTLDDHYWSQESMALFGSMDAGILDLMPTDWPDMENEEPLYSWNTEVQTYHSH